MNSQKRSCRTLSRRAVEGGFLGFWAGFLFLSLLGEVDAGGVSGIPLVAVLRFMVAILGR